LQRAHDFQAGHDAETSVEFSTGGLGVDMASCGDRCEIRVVPRPTAEDISDLVYAYAQAGIFHPTDNQIPGFAVQWRERQAAIPAFRGGADCGEVHQRLPQPWSIDFQGGNGRVHGWSLNQSAALMLIGSRQATSVL